MKENRSPRIVRISWGHMEVEGLTPGKDFKLYPGGGRAWDWNETNTRHTPGIQPADVQELIREVQRLGPGNFPGDPALVDQLRTQLLANVDKLELQLRRDLDAQQSGQIRSGDSYRVPEGYQDPVAEYFRRLSERH